MGMDEYALTYNKTFNDIHKLTVLLGTEAIRDGLGRKLTGRRYNYLFEDNTNSWVLNMGRITTSVWRIPNIRVSLLCLACSAV